MSSDLNNKNPQHFSEVYHSVVVPSIGSPNACTSPLDVPFVPLPASYKALKDATPHRLILKFGEPIPRVYFGIDIYGDVILGRGVGDLGMPLADLDLSKLNAADLGVSRRHALLRPTGQKVFLIDMGSTNGSFVNHVPVGRGMAQEVRSGDSITLSGLTFSVSFVKVEKWPEEYDTRDLVETVRFVIFDESGIPTAKWPAKKDDEETGKVSPTLPPKELPYVKSLRVAPSKPVTKEFSKKDQINRRLSEWIDDDK